MLAYAVPPLRLVDAGFGEFTLAVHIAVIAPALGFVLQQGEYHRLVAIVSFPLTLLALAYFLILGFSHLRDRRKIRPPHTPAQHGLAARRPFTSWPDFRRVSLAGQLAALWPGLGLDLALLSDVALCHPANLLAAQYQPGSQTGLEPADYQRVGCLRPDCLLADLCLLAALTYA